MGGFEGEFWGNSLRFGSKFYEEKYLQRVGCFLKGDAQRLGEGFTAFDFPCASHFPIEL